MRIDGTHGVDPQGLPGSTPPKVEPTAWAEGMDAKNPTQGAMARSVPGRYVGEALAAEEVDKPAVAQARRLLQSGQLDTPEASRRAAKSLIELGI